MKKEEFIKKYKYRKRHGEIDVFEDGELIAEMMDLRDIQMGIIPHWMSKGKDEIEIVMIIKVLENIDNFDIAMSIIKMQEKYKSMTNRRMK
tara:strand:- start:2376 stop:2648 length:273 start_codon:yes stop_codon:yes gene_type:complete